VRVRAQLRFGSCDNLLLYKDSLFIDTGREIITQAHTFQP
jgi:hypothetical protein